MKQEKSGNKPPDGWVEHKTSVNVEYASYSLTMDIPTEV